MPSCCIVLRTWAKGQGVRDIKWVICCPHWSASPVCVGCGKCSRMHKIKVHLYMCVYIIKSRHTCRCVHLSHNQYVLVCTYAIPCMCTCRRKVWRSTVDMISESVNLSVSNMSPGFVNGSNVLVHHDCQDVAEVTVICSTRVALWGMQQHACTSLGHHDASLSQQTKRFCMKYYKSPLTCHSTIGRNPCRRGAASTIEICLWSAVQQLLETLAWTAWRSVLDIFRVAVVAVLAHWLLAILAASLPSEHLSSDINNTVIRRDLCSHLSAKIFWCFFIKLMQYHLKL